MEFFNSPLTLGKIKRLQNKWGDYNLEILDPERRKKFIETVKEFFKLLWA